MSTRIFFALEAKIVLWSVTSVSHILTVTNYQVIFDLFIQVSDLGPHGPLVSYMTIIVIIIIIIFNFF